MNDQEPLPQSSLRAESPVAGVSRLPVKFFPPIISEEPLPIQVNLQSLDSTAKVELFMARSDDYASLLIHSPEEYRLIHASLQTQEEKNALFAGTLDYVYRHKEDYSYRRAVDPGVYAYYSPLLLTEVDDIIDSLTLYDRETCLCVLSEEKDSEKANVLLGMIVDKDGFTNTINTVRSLVGDKTLGSKRRESLEKIGKTLLGFDPESPITFYKALQDLYAAIHFEEYSPNIESTAEEGIMLEKIIEEIGLKGGKVVDIGCGTGRLTNWLAARPIISERQLEIVGLDISERNIEVAKSDDHSKMVEFLRGDWNDLPFDSESIDMAIILGRSLPHVEDRIFFNQALREVCKKMKPGAILIMDMPNPNQGHYLRERRRYVEFLRNVGIQFRELKENDTIPEIATIIDSPDGINFYNRYVPQFEQIDLILREAGFTIIRQFDKPIPGEKGDENMYFVVQKRETVIPLPPPFIRPHPG